MSTRRAKQQSGVGAFILMMFAAGVFLCPIASTAEELADNAALQYWKAIGVMLKPGNEDQFVTYEFIDTELPNLSPTALAAKPDALLQLLKERSMLSALQSASTENACVFPVYRKGNPRPELTHLGKLVVLTRRALACAKAHEFAGDATGASEIYANLLKLAQHLDQDHTVYSCLAGADIVQMILSDLVGFASRNQEAAAFTPLVSAYREAPEFIFHPSVALREQRERYADWLTANPELLVRKLESLYGDAKLKPAVERLMPRDAADKQELLEEWLEGYRRWMLDLSRAFDMPYKQGMLRLQELDERKKKMAKDRTGGPNPLIPLLAPTASELYQRLLLAEAQFDMGELLCLAGLYRGDVSQWPLKISDLQPLSYHTMPTDPFTEEEFYYRVFHNAPLIVARIPKWMARNNDYLHKLNLSERRQADERSTARIVKAYKKQQAEDMKAEVPMSK